MDIFIDRLWVGLPCLGAGLKDVLFLFLIFYHVFCSVHVFFFETWQSPLQRYFFSLSHRSYFVISLGWQVLIWIMTWECEVTVYGVGKRNSMSQ